MCKYKKNEQMEKKKHFILKAWILMWHLTCNKMKVTGDNC